ncbi:hypothetical protein [Microcystis aeruginosa]|uniref:hypothetical protein n=1 Tax=Microcystis aeruginosa TaxID=1126 RepID=UPI001C20183B|nr:hypothetical protein [Microcystis aeruginosa]
MPLASPNQEVNFALLLSSHLNSEVLTFPFGGASRQDSFVIGKLGYTSPLGKTLSQSTWKMS